ncbi:unnamed protein product [Microthlaspi erraticum]|uniref:FBD domain-containing protein n=1 Tax=Microthlaspi erraticum TaxID=1685480 RepID=A0A6D2L9H7_9BRAS|nr:unnamed protein product [Microthlaspi erraticum]
MMKTKAGAFVVDAPLLESLDIADHNDSGCCYIHQNMPELVSACLDINYMIFLWTFLGCITSVKRLYLCSSTIKNAYPEGSVFHRLVHLTLCTCGRKWLKFLSRLLRDSPKLQVLRFEQCHELPDDEPRPCWNEPSSVPECVVSSLATLEWVKYEGTEEEKGVVAFIFRSARCLKKATISSKSTDPVKKLEMLKELTFLSRCSTTCHLTFD